MSLPSLLGHVLVNNIVPIFLVIGAGFMMARATAIDPNTLSKAALYIFSPCLVYTLLTTVEIRADEALRISTASAVIVLASGGLAWGIGRLIGLGRVTLTALMLVAMFANAGNYGLALNQLAFGEAGLARATICFVTISILTHTLGIYLASSGRLSARQAIKAVFSIPPVYAVILAAGTVATGVSLPGPLSITISVLGSAAIPVLLILLGVRIAREPRMTRIRLVGLASGLRLVAGAIIALGSASLLQLSGPARQATVIQGSMPTAVMVTVIATEFNIEPAFVTSTVVLGTLLSPLTLTLLVAFLS